MNPIRKKYDLECFIRRTVPLQDVATPLAWWRETALWWAAVLWLWVGGVTRSSQKGHCGPCCCAFAMTDPELKGGAFL